MEWRLGVLGGKWEEGCVFSVDDTAGGVMDLCYTDERE